MNLNDLKVQALPNTLKTIESYSHKMCPNDKLQSIFIYLWQSKRTQYTAWESIEWAIVLSFFFYVIWFIYFSSSFLFVFYFQWKYHLRVLILFSHWIYLFIF